MQINGGSPKYMEIAYYFIYNEGNKKFFKIDVSFMEENNLFYNPVDFYQYFIDILKSYSFRKNPHWAEITNEKLFKKSLRQFHDVYIYDTNPHNSMQLLFDKIKVDLEFSNYLLKNKTYLKKDFKIENRMSVYGARSEMEDIMDEIDLIIRKRKGDQLIKSLIPKKIINIVDVNSKLYIQDIANADIDKSEINRLKSKVFKCKTTTDLNNYLILFLNNALMWSKKEKLAELSTIKDINIVTHLDYKNLLLVRVDSYKAMSKIGSSSWCIATSESMWNSYLHEIHGNTQWILYNFNLPSTAKDSMVGITQKLDNNIYAAHYKDDTEVFVVDIAKNTDDLEVYSEDDIDDEFVALNDSNMLKKYSYENIFNVFKVNVSQEDQIEYCMNISHIPFIEQDIDIEQAIEQAGIHSVMILLLLYGNNKSKEILKKISILKRKNEDLYNELLTPYFKKKFCKNISLEKFSQQDYDEVYFILLDLFENDNEKINKKITKHFVDWKDGKVLVFGRQYPNYQLNALHLYIQNKNNRTALSITLIGLILALPSNYRNKLLNSISKEDINYLYIKKSEHLAQAIIKIVDANSNVYENIIKVFGDGVLTPSYFDIGVSSYES
jgi:hypothetical protein